MNYGPHIKIWAYGLAIGLLLGGFVGYKQAYTNILKDCQIVGMFRIGDAPLSCTYHLVDIPSLPKEKEKK